MRIFKSTTLYSLVVALLFSCGFASAEPALHRFTYMTAHQVCHMSARPVEAQMQRERAVVEWQYEVAQGSRVARSDMHASSAGFVFTAMTTDPLTGINLAT
jgi:hypothetical protein